MEQAYYIDGCPLHSECCMRQTTAKDKRLVFYAHSPENVVQKVAWHLYMSTLHQKGWEEAETIASAWAEGEILLWTLDSGEEPPWKKPRLFEAVASGSDAGGGAAQVGGAVADMLMQSIVDESVCKVKQHFNKHLESLQPKDTLTGAINLADKSLNVIRKAILRMNGSKDLSPWIMDCNSKK